jgi:hypothetical protein
LTDWPTFIVGQTRSGPLAGQGELSLKLAVDPGVAAAPATSATSVRMNVKRFMTPATSAVRLPILDPTVEESASGRSFLSINRWPLLAVKTPLADDVPVGGDLV